MREGVGRRVGGGTARFYANQRSVGPLLPIAYLPHTPQFNEMVSKGNLVAAVLSDVTDNIIVSATMVSNHPLTAATTK